MPRPKGSKNKKTLDKERQIPIQIDQLQKARDSLAEELAVTKAAMDEQKEKAKQIRARIRKLDTELGRLHTQAEELAQRARQKELQNNIGAAVQDLLKRGMTPEDILSKLK